MNAPTRIDTKISVCPHDCPSACSLEVDVIEGSRIGRVRGARQQTYTAGVVCAKVARYAERIHHPERLMKPLQRVGAKGSGDFREISWDDALDLTAEKLLAAELEFGAESVWPYYYAGTMGRVMKDGINRLRHVKKYSGFFGTICTTPIWTGYIAGAGKLAGVDPREMAKSDCVVIWGTNPVNTQVNVMTHAVKARKERGAKIVAIDIYRNATVEQADIGIVLRPGTDGAFACAVMHVLFRDGYADWDYLEKYTDCPRDLETHLQTRTPEWAAAITGLSVDEIESFAKLVGQTKRTFFRLGYGFGRQRNGSVNVHAALSVAAVTGAWQYEGGGAFHNNGAIYHWNNQVIEGLDARDASVRMLDQCQIGRILTGDREALRGGGPVKALFIQNTNPMTVAPEQRLVRQGFLREDLFTCVHEQFMTETAQVADIVLPATMFMEHDDIYSGGGHQHIMLGPKLIEPPGECRSNHDVIVALAKRLGAEHPGFEKTPRELIDITLRDSGWGGIAEVETHGFRDVQPAFEDAHFLNGFGFADGKFRFRPDWKTVPNGNDGLKGRWDEMPSLPDHWAVTEESDQEHPFRLATSPSRSYLNTSFNETPGSQAREGNPSLMMHPLDAAAIGVADGEVVSIGNRRGEIEIAVSLFDGLQRGILIAEGLHPNKAHRRGEGINVLTGADQVAPYGGAAFHDNRVWVRRIVSTA